jgi:DNA repair protein SbcC/Rad50
MHFISLKWQNLFSFGNYETELSLDRNGIIFVNGINTETGTSNGSGKSSITNIFTWALYGQTLKDMPIDNIKCSHSRGYGWAQIMFQMGKSVYTLDRYRKHSIRGNGVTIQKDNEDPIHYGTLKKAQAKIDNIIGLDFQSFVASLIFSTEVAFEFPKMKPEKRREFMETITKMYSYTEIGKQAAKKVRDLRRNQSTLETTLTERKRYLGLEKEDYVKHSKLHEGFAAEKDEKVCGLREDLQQTVKSLKDIDQSLRESLESQRKALSEANESIYAKLHKLEVYLASAKSLPKELSNSYEKLLTEQEGEVDKVERWRDRELKLIDKKITLMDKACPTCDREWEFSEVKDITKDLLEKSKDISKQSDDMVAANKKVISDLGLEWLPRISTAEKKLAKLNSSILKSREKHSKSSQELKEIEEKIESLPSKDAIDALKRKQEKISTEIQAVSSSESPYKITINNLRGKIQTLMSEIDELIVTKNGVDDDLKYAAFWDDSLNSDGLKLFIFEQIIPVLNNRIMYYLPMLFSGMEITLAFDKHLNMVIVKDGEIMPYGGLSMGEKKRIDLAISLGLLETAQTQHGVVSNIMWLDELIDSSLDETGINIAMDILRDIPVPCKFLISHRSEISDQFDDVINVEKRGKLSQVL